MMESRREKRKRDFEETQRLVSMKRKENERLRKLDKILHKNAEDRTEDEKFFLDKNQSFVSVAESRIIKKNLLKQRTEEYEDELSILNDKIDKLVDLINVSEHICVYSGAGISTSSNIPDYRGSNGVWTQINKNGSIQKTQDLALATPTLTHMSLRKLVEQGIVKHCVSQNCDGLHLRSGLPMNRLSEIHGNMFVEVCPNCNRTFHRDFDVTARTNLRQHGTGRFCTDCVGKLNDKDKFKCELSDTIVHFGEKGKLEYPLNWSGAVESVSKADLIICIGSSLKVLKNYPCLWPKKNDKKKKVHIAIINLMWTPKDNQATIKLNAKCDLVMESIMSKLNLSIPNYNKDEDKLKDLYIPLNSPEEQATCQRYQLFSQKIKQEIDLSPNDSSHEITPGWFGKGIKRNKL